MIGLKKMTKEEIIEFLEERCDEIGFRRHCGIEFVSFENNKLVLSMKITPEVSNRHGIAHGGALSGLLDTVMGLSCIIFGKNVVTSNLNVNFIRGPRIGTTVYASANILHSGMSVMVTEGKCYDDKGTLYASATGSFYVLRNRV